MGRRIFGATRPCGRSKKEIFNYIRERVGKKSRGCKEKFLTQAGRNSQYIYLAVYSNICYVSLFAAEDFV